MKGAGVTKIEPYRHGAPAEAIGIIVNNIIGCINANQAQLALAFRVNVPDKKAVAWIGARRTYGNSSGNGICNYNVIRKGKPGGILLAGKDGVGPFGSIGGTGYMAFIIGGYIA